MDQNTQNLIQQFKRERHQLIAMYSETITDLHATIAQQQQTIAAQQNEIKRLTASRDSARLEAAE
jgi:uncharacterized coiled-coil protein SlyX